MSVSGSPLGVVGQPAVFWINAPPPIRGDALSIHGVVRRSFFVIIVLMHGEPSRLSEIVSAMLLSMR